MGDISISDDDIEAVVKALKSDFHWEYIRKSRKITILMILLRKQCMPLNH